MEFTSELCANKRVTFLEPTKVEMDEQTDSKGILTDEEYAYIYPAQVYVYTQMVDFGRLSPKIVAATLKADEYWKKQLWKDDALKDKIACTDLKHWMMMIKVSVAGGNSLWVLVDEVTIQNKLQVEYKVLTKQQMEPIADHVVQCGIKLGDIEISVEMIFELAVTNELNGTAYCMYTNNCQNWLLAFINSINMVLMQATERGNYDGDFLRRPDKLKSYEEQLSKFEKKVKKLLGKSSGSSANNRNPGAARPDEPDMDM